MATQLPDQVRKVNRYAGTGLICATTEFVAASGLADHLEDLASIDSRLAVHRVSMYDKAMAVDANSGALKIRKLL